MYLCVVYPTCRTTTTGVLRHTDSRKRATVLAVMKKIHMAASDNITLYKSAMERMNEFRDLGYPIGVRKFICAVMATTYSDLTWRRVRRFQT